MKVNETVLKSIVTQPWEHNYIYAKNFDRLGHVQNLLKDFLFGKACRDGVSVSPGVLSGLMLSTDYLSFAILSLLYAFWSGLELFPIRD